MGSKEIKLNPGESIFKEGDQSSSLYFLKRGSVRIYKSKGVGSIELDSIRAGQIFGELSFLDNQPRSASAEAITQIELLEISKPTLDDEISRMPEWFSALIRTITSRLRNTNNRLRALESLSTDYETDKFGNRSKEFAYINSSELLKFTTALILVCARYGKPSPEGVEISTSNLERFASQILQVGSSKVFSLLETFKTVKVITDDNKVKNQDFLDFLIQFLNSENLVEPSKKRMISEMGFKALVMIAQNRQHAKKVDQQQEQLNVAPLLDAAGVTLTQIQELLDQKVLTGINMVSGNEAYAVFESTKFENESLVFSILNEISKLNEKKRKGSAI